MSGIIVVFVTTGSADEARKIGRTLVEEGLAACCNVIQPVESIFKWQGKLNIETEGLMIIKTQEGLFKAVESKVKQIHSYEEPEIIAMPVTQGSESYINWVLRETRAV